MKRSTAEIRNATLLLCIRNAFRDKINSNPCNPGTTQNPPTTTVVGFRVKSVNQNEADTDYDENTFNDFSAFDATCN